MSRRSSGIIFIAVSVALNAYAMTSNLANSMLELQQGAGEEIFAEVVLEAEKDPQKTFMQHIVTHVKHPSLWEPLARMGLDKNKIGAADLVFIIREISKPYFITEKERAKKIFDQLIINGLGNPSKQPQIIQLLTEVSIAQPGGWASPFGAPKPKEARNLLVECIEMGYMEAVGAIIAAWPKGWDSLHQSPALTLTSQVADLEASGLYTVYKDGDKRSLNLVEWLMRDDGSAHTYMTGAYKSANYIKAAQLLLSYTIGRKTCEIKGDMLGMAALLERQKELPDRFSFPRFVGLVKNTTGVNWETIPVDQREQIKKMLK